MTFVWSYFAPVQVHLHFLPTWTSTCTCTPASTSPPALPPVQECSCDPHQCALPNACACSQHVRARSVNQNWWCFNFWTWGQAGTLLIKGICIGSLSRIVCFTLTAGKRICISALLVCCNGDFVSPWRLRLPSNHLACNNNFPLRKYPCSWALCNYIGPGQATKNPNSKLAFRHAALPSPGHEP